MLCLLRLSFLLSLANASASCCYKKCCFWSCSLLLLARALESCSTLYIILFPVWRGAPSSKAGKFAGSQALYVCLWLPSSCAEVANFLLLLSSCFLLLASCFYWLSSFASFLFWAAGQLLAIASCQTWLLFSFVEVHFRLLTIILS